MGPSRWWFVTAGVIAVAGVVVSAVLFARAFVSYDDRIDALQRIPVPGTGVVDLDEAGGYSVYYEGFDPEPEVDVEIDGVDLRRFVGRFTYSNGAREGVALHTFRVDEPGVYRVRAGGESVGAVAVGRSVGDGLFRRIALAVGIGGLAVVTGIVITIVVAVQRATRRRSAFPPARPGP